MSENKDMREIVKEGYEKGDYDKKYRGDETKIGAKEEELFADFLKNLSDKPKVLDFGCGTGRPYVEYLLEKGCKVTGIDICKKHIDKARNNFPQGQFILGDFSNYNFADSFDAIVSLYTVFHIPRTEHRKLFVKMKNLLTERGKILVTVGAEAGEFSSNDFCGAKMAWSTHDPKTYIDMLKEVGFEILTTRMEGELEGEDEYHFWILAQKE